MSNVTRSSGDVSVFNKRSIVSRVSSSTLSRFLLAEEDGDLHMMQDYQRDYEWTEVEQQSLLESVFSGYNIGSISLIQRSTSSPYLEIIDGKQRLTTLILFVRNKISYTMPSTGEVVFYRDLDLPSQRSLKNSIPISVEEIIVGFPSDEPTKSQILEHFWRKNFAGKQLSQAHRDSVEQMMLDAKEAAL